jgi:hypothetical protein
MFDIGVESKIEVVIDNNEIDSVVNKFKPTHAIIEALWVVPTKFFVLSKLHPDVKWIIRLHSEMPFLAGEGMALDWLGDYVSFPNIIIGVNAPRALDEVKFFLGYKMGWDKQTADERVIYLPNFYPQEYKTKIYDYNKESIDICCFGAIRPLKNHIMQAIAAIKFAEYIKKPLNFHINSGRIEMKGEPFLNNLIGLFSHISKYGHQLIVHEWQPRLEFLETCSKMDIGMQVSFSETFNIVGADLISQGVPIVGSKEIPWIDHWFCANPTETEEIYRALILTHTAPDSNVSKNQYSLKIYTDNTKIIWENYFNKK